MERYNIAVIGAGVIGCAVAYCLSRFDVRVAVVEQAADVAAGTSGRNSAVVHAGFNNREGSLMAKLCVEGSQSFETLCRTIDVPYCRTGKYLLAFDEEDRRILSELLSQGKRNGVRGLRLLEQKELRSVLSQTGGICALHSAETAITDPFLYTIALAETACMNGVSFFFNSRVTEITSLAEGYRLRAGDKELETEYLVNAAGLSSGAIAEQLGVSGYHIYPCRGEYLILDQIADELLSVPIYPAPKRGIGGLGVHLTPTTEGNLLIGPSASYLDDGDDTATTAPVLEQLFREAKQLLPTLERRQIIGAYSGNRAKLAPPAEGGFRDFVIRIFPEAPRAVQLLGIESPGLTASMPIAKMVVKLLGDRCTFAEKQNWNPPRKRPLRFRELPVEQRQRLISEDPEYGEIVCRCKQITKREIRDAIEGPLGARTLTGIKYRCRATTGRCQGGYCLARIADMLIHDYGMKPEEISLRSGESCLFTGKIREVGS